MCTSGTQPTCARDAITAIRAGLEYLATADGSELTAAEQADCLRGLAAAGSQHLAATAAMLAAFENSGGCADDGQMTARSWLRWQTRISSAAARDASQWTRRLAHHPDIGTALAAGTISPSYAREMCDWTDRLPEEHRARADQILLDAAAGGADLADLGGLAEEIRRRTARPDADHGDEKRFEGRWLRLTTHWRGYARLDGELTPQAAAAVRALLESLGKKPGPEDDRTQAQRDHDALEEGCRRLIAGGLPDRAGQPTQIMLTMTLHDLLNLPGASQALATWDASGAPAPPGAECDAAVQPIITGHVDPGVLDQIASQLGGAEPALAADTPALGTPAVDTPALDTSAMAARAAAQLSVAHATRLLSGPGGLASWLRTSQLTGPAATISLPLDIGAATDTIPPHLRRAIIRRDQHCRFPGCLQPPAACHVHHLIPRSEGGTTSLDNCALACTFHHLIAIHRWGWTVTLNPDGTTTATHPTQPWRTLHSHGHSTAA